MKRPLWISVTIIALAIGLIVLPASALGIPPFVNCTFVAPGNTAPTGWYNVPVTIQFQDIGWADPIDHGTYAITEVLCSRNGGTPWSVVPTSTLSLHLDGNYYVQAQGTWGGFAYPLSFGIDRTAPRARCDARPHYLTSATISISATDALSGVSAISYQLDNHAAVTAAVPAETATLTFSVGSGRHVVRWKAIDVANNASRWGSARFTVALKHRH